MSEVDLRLAPRLGLEAYNGLLGRLGPDLLDVELQLRDPAAVAGRAHLLEEASGSELGILGQTLADERLVGIQLGRLRRPGPVADLARIQIPLELAALDPAVDRLSADAESSGELGLRIALLEIVLEQHARLPSDHGRLRP